MCIRSEMGVFMALLLAGCGTNPPGQGGAANASAPAAAGVDWFTDVAQASGLDFTHFNGMSGQFYYPEIMAPGVALLDYDNDGDLDVYVTQGQMLGTTSTATAGARPAGRGPLK